MNLPSPIPHRRPAFALPANPATVSHAAAVSRNILMPFLSTLRRTFASLCVAALAFGLSACGGSPGAATTTAAPGPAYTVQGMPNLPGVDNARVLASSARQRVGVARVGGLDHPMAWVGDANTPVDISTADYTNQMVFAVDGNVAVGSGYAGLANHALAWTSPTGPVVDLHSAAYESTAAVAVSGTLVVGYGMRVDDSVPLAWVDLQPGPTEMPHAGFTHVALIGVQGTQVVGFGEAGTAPHALLWRDITAAPADLHPPGYRSSAATAIDNGHVVGNGTTGTGNDVALLWVEGTPTATVLAAPGAKYAQAWAIRGTRIGGVAYQADNTFHAVVWDDLGMRFTDLHALLDGYRENGSAVKLTSSTVSAIGFDGTVYGWGMDAAGAYHSLAWSPRA